MGNHIFRHVWTEDIIGRRVLTSLLRILRQADGEDGEGCADRGARKSHFSRHGFLPLFCG